MDAGTQFGMDSVGNAKKSLTVISITKNDSEGLARTLASTEVWRGEAWIEHVVVDASSEPVRVGDPRIRVISQVSTGISGAFNEGLANAGGEWVWFLNGGDEVDPRLDPAWLQALLVTSRAQILVGAVTYAGEEEPRPHLPPVERWPSLQAWIPHPATLVRRSLFERFGPFDKKYSIVMDYEWWLRALSTGVAVDVLSVPFAIFAPGGISQRKDCQERVGQERDDVIRRNQFHLWQIWFASGCRLLRASGRAFVARRIGKHRGELPSCPLPPP